MITSRLPQGDQALDMVPAVRQINSLRDAGAEVDVLQVQGWSKLKYIQAIPQLIKRSRSADIIHGHYAFCGWLARLRLGKPVVVSFMGDDLLGTPDVDGKVSASSQLIVQTSRWLARWADSVIVKSAEMAQVVAPVNAHVVPNGVDLETFTPMDRQAARAMLGWDPNKRYVLFPGNPNNPRKGYRFAEATIQHAMAAEPNLPIELQVLWNVAPKHVPLYMNACDLMLMASYIEGSPNVVKEAMACNLPVVSVPVGDVAEMLDGVAHSKVCPRETESVSAALLELIGSDARSNGREVLQHRGLDLASVASRVLTIYEEVLAA